jgi:hypothetical protein
MDRAILDAVRKDPGPVEDSRTADWWRELVSLGEDRTTVPPSLMARAREAFERDPRDAFRAIALIQLARHATDEATARTWIGRARVALALLPGELWPLLEIDRLERELVGSGRPAAVDGRRGEAGSR